MLPIIGEGNVALCKRKGKKMEGWGGEEEVGLGLRFRRRRSRERKRGEKKGRGGRGLTKLDCMLNARLF